MRHHHFLLSDRTPLTVISPQQLQSGVCLLVDFPPLGGPLFFLHPVKLLIAHQVDQVRQVLEDAEAASLAGHWVGGFLTYEAAAAFGLPVFSLATTQPSPDLPVCPALTTQPSPLAWFAIFPPPHKIVYPPPDCFPELAIAPPVPTILVERYQRDLSIIAAKIAAGESYQVNYTLDARLTSSTEPAQLFLQLQSAHRFPQAMWLHDGMNSVASLSPERFLERHGKTLLTAPIKGTRPRGREPASDQALGTALEASEKDQAEHVMIVDMARNDLGRICQNGSVTVAPLMTRRAFSTVFHLESCVHGRLQPGVGLAGIMEAMFPAASITGAPKQRTMEIIRELEQRPRGIYTGCMGVIQPGGDFFFNVAIRTLVWSPALGFRVGLGGGVVADSDPTKEWSEIEDKGRFLTEIPPPLTLIETFLVKREGADLQPHLQRMSASAAALGFSWDKEHVKSVAQAGLDSMQEGPYPKVGRLSLAMNGQVTFSHRAWQSWPMGLTVRVAAWRPDSLDHLLRHKTTRRLHLDAELIAARQAGYDEVLFVSVVGQITEGAMTAVLVRLDGCWYAPPLEDGLLPSLWRQREMVRLGAVTRSMTLKDLAQAQKIVMGNAVRGGVVVTRLDDVWGQVIYKSGS